MTRCKKETTSCRLAAVQIPANSMEGTPSELVGGDHNDQTVQPSAEDIRKEQRRQRDNKRKEREQVEVNE
ncbi:hypothetical protein NC652_032197 [Populus alba x Populus x berolinensis]|nr:hypothetical protein NC652_032197 [Populus alba x Populus x berolinensis]